MDYRTFLHKYKQYLIMGVVIIALCIIVTLVLVKSNANTLQEEELTMPSASSSQLPETESISRQIYVDIKGAVKKPGMYEATENMRVWDAVMLAGGISDEADTNQVNFSERIIDQMVIYVPKIGEIIQNPEKNNDSKENPTTDSEKINLNKASETELQTLPGVGQKKAQEIIRYREENGGFKTIEDLKNIAGFGEKTFEKLKDSITS